MPAEASSFDPQHSHSAQTPAYRTTPRQGLCRTALAFAAQPVPQLQHGTPCPPLSQLPAASIPATFETKTPARSTCAGYSCSCQAAAACIASWSSVPGACIIRLLAAAGQRKAPAARLPPIHTAADSALLVLISKNSTCMQPSCVGHGKLEIFKTTPKLPKLVCRSRGVPRR